MRIAMMADTYKPHVSGVTNHISLTSKSLAEIGHQVHIFTLGQEPAAGDEPYVVRSPGVPLSDTGFFLGFRYTKQARRQLQSMDVIHVHHPFLSGRLALRYARPVNIPVVFTNHSRYDLMAQAYLPLVPDEVTETILETYLPMFCRQVDAIVVPSNSVREVLRQLGVEDPIEVIPNGVEIGPFRNADPMPRAPWGFSEKDTLLIYVGRVAPEKNMTLLLRAFAGVQAAYPEAALLIVGDGPVRADLEADVRQMGLGDRVHFTGNVDYAQLPGYLRAADVFVTASVTEVHPLSVIEALASGLPVAGIRAPGVQDTVIDNQTGVLAPDSLAGYTAKLTRLVGDREARAAMAAHAKASAETYDIGRTSALLADLYARLIKDGPRRRASDWRVLWRRLVNLVS
jgi:glycosyltransferase involved in cell wall biosynthesis